MYRALYRKWRPRTFDDVCGQDRITDILKYEVANGKTSHAYLFCGSRGTGKTSCAKILAKAVNCEHPENGNPCNACAACRAIDAGTATDVIEMDAASNTGVENVRDIKDEIVFTPAELTYRVYIIDEVHMMSGSAFNALLKTLEEPPEHVIFILATTELQKLPSTIVSRCQRFDFRRLSTPVIVARLTQIAKAENIDLREDGARLLARMALGGMRDAISLLELCAGADRVIDAKQVTDMLGAGNRAAMEELVRAVAKRDYPTIYGQIAEEVMSSRDLLVFFRGILDYYRDLLVVKTAPSAKEYLDLTDEEYTSLRRLSDEFTMGALLYHSRVLEDAYAQMQRSDASKRAIAELALTRLCEPKLSDTTESLLARIEALEGELARLKYGGAVRAAAEEAPGVSPAPPSAEIPESSVPEAPRETAPAAAETVFRSMSNWSEIISKITKTRPSMHGFLDTAKAYRSEGRDVYLVRASSPFCAKMLNRPETLEALRLTIAEEEGQEMSAFTVRVESDDVKDDGNRFIDEIEQNLLS